MPVTPEWDFQFTTGQHHYQKGKSKDELATNVEKAGFEAEKFNHLKKVAKADSN